MVSFIALETFSHHITKNKEYTVVGEGDYGWIIIGDNGSQIYMTPVNLLHFTQVEERMVYVDDDLLAAAKRIAYPHTYLGERKRKSKQNLQQMRGGYD